MLHDEDPAHREPEHARGVVHGQPAYDPQQDDLPGGDVEMVQQPGHFRRNVRTSGRAAVRIRNGLAHDAIHLADRMITARESR